MEKEEIQMHKETCFVCGYEGFDDDTSVNERGKCPKCGATKITTCPEGEEPEEIIAIKDALDQARKELLSINLEGLEDKWSLTSHENCCECGMNFEENDECPLRLWKNAGDPNCTELALCWICAKKRMDPDTKEG